MRQPTRRERGPTKPSAPDEAFVAVAMEGIVGAGMGVPPTAAAVVWAESPLARPNPDGTLLAPTPSAATATVLGTAVLGMADT